MAEHRRSTSKLAHASLRPYPLGRGADRLKIQNPPTRRMYLRVSADPLETTASRHFNLSLHVLLSVSRRKFLQSPAAKLAWVVRYRTVGCAVAILTLLSWIPAGSRASREQARMARVSCAHAQGLFWCEHVDRSPRPHIAKKCRHRCRKM